MFKCAALRLSAAVLAVTIGQTGFAQTASDRMAQATQLNALVHEAAASVCMINAGINVPAEIDTLAEARRGFNVTLAAFSDAGDVKDVDNILLNWLPLDGAMSMMVVGDTPADYIEIVNDGQAQLEAATLMLIDRTSHAYLEAEDVSTADMISLDLAERQSVLLQKIKRMACELGTQASTEAGRVALTEAIRLYEVTHDTLANGADDLGIAAPDSFAVRQVLAAAAYDWALLQPILDRIVMNAEVSASDLSGLQVRVAGLQAQMPQLVAGYLAPTVASSSVAFLDESAG